jgi:hypothetical protein
MTMTAVPTLATYLAEPLTAGEPDVAGPLAVFPLFGPEPRLPYVAFAQAVAHGARVHELEGGASVGDLTVVNPLDVAVLLYDGEEVLGAQQNRTFDVSVLVPAGAKLDVPVSCVEQGRWDGTRHADDFAPAPQAAHPALRRAKARAVRERAQLGLEARADQHEVWDEVMLKHELHGTASPTGALHDLFEQRRHALGELRADIGRRDGQVGMLAAFGGRFAVLDHTSRPEVFAALQDPLVQGYALDALEQPEAEPPGVEEAQAFLEKVWAQRLGERDGLGLGRDGRFAGDGVGGAALLCGDELVQLTAFAEDDDQIRPRRSRIRRPSRRRPA